MAAICQSDNQLPIKDLDTEPPWVLVLLARADDGVVLLVRGNSNYNSRQQTQSVGFFHYHESCIAHCSLPVVPLKSDITITSTYLASPLLSFAIDRHDNQLCSPLVLSLIISASEQYLLLSSSSFCSIMGVCSHSFSQRATVRPFSQSAGSPRHESAKSSPVRSENSSPVSLRPSITQPLSCESFIASPFSPCP